MQLEDPHRDTVGERNGKSSAGTQTHSAGLPRCDNLCYPLSKQESISTLFNLRSHDNTINVGHTLEDWGWNPIHVRLNRPGGQKQDGMGEQMPQFDLGKCQVFPLRLVVGAW